LKDDTSCKQEVSRLFLAIQLFPTQKDPDVRREDTGATTKEGRNFFLSFIYIISRMSVQGVAIPDKQKPAIPEGRRFFTAE
jgi:hypothetical protein